MRVQIQIALLAVAVIVLALAGSVTVYRVKALEAQHATLREYVRQLEMELEWYKADVREWKAKHDEPC